MHSVFVDSVRQEIAKEQAEGLGFTEKRFLAALEAYKREAVRGASAEAGVARERALWDLVAALTGYVVQREACGLRDAHDFYGFHQVPPEAIARMGIRRPAADSSRGRLRRASRQ